VNEEKIDLRHPYLTRQIIAYIGNKRRLLPLIHTALVKCGYENQRETSFLDLFAGSGVVSRLARLLNFRVVSNDWEYYTYVINKAYLGIEQKELRLMFREQGGLEKLLDSLNSVADVPAEDQYVSRYYSPSSEANNLDFKRERMFYTRRNGLAIDRIRNRIEELYPEEKVRRVPANQKEKYLLLALLLYESATHTNTSGVFKAYHKGFGGHGGDALRRILAAIELRAPVLINCRYPSEVYCEDALALISSDQMKNRRWDIAYLDPPYNQHQYGSNYHLLNTIALWDRPPVDNSLNERGVLKDKAAIRKDWTQTRSDYCYRESAEVAFSRLIDTFDAAHILLSYSTEGLIPFEALMDICTRRGELEIVTNQYVKYPGGKQSISRAVRNIEFVLIVHTGKKNRRGSLRKIELMLLRRRLGLLLDKKYSYEKLKQNFAVHREDRTFELEGAQIRIATRHFFELIPPYDFERLSEKDLDELTGRLEKSLCGDKEEELQEIMRIIEEGESDRAYFVRKIPATLKKFAHKKYRALFSHWIERVKALKVHEQELYALIEGKIEELETLALKRFTN